MSERRASVSLAANEPIKYLSSHVVHVYVTRVTFFLVHFKAFIALKTAFKQSLLYSLRKLIMWVV